MIVKAGASIGYDAFRQLVDEVTDPDFVPDVRALVETHFASSDGVGLESARAFKSGADVLVDLVLVVPGSLSVAEAHDLERRVDKAIRAEKKGVREVAVRFKPA